VQAPEYIAADIVTGDYKKPKRRNYKQGLENKHRGPWREHRNAIQPSILTFL
jgi:hypothetical protein